MKSLQKILCCSLPLFCLTLPSCKDKDAIKVYKVSKAEPETQAPQNAMSPAGAAHESAGIPPMGNLPSMESAPSSTPAVKVTGKAPSHWEVQPLSTMRQASYHVNGEKGALVDISLVTLAGGAGGVLENVNRWLSQLGQPPIKEEDLKKLAQHVNSALGDVTVVDLVGMPQGADAAKEGRIIAGIASGDNKTYFFKMHGNAQLTEAQKESFLQWISGIGIAPSASETPTPQSAAPAAAPATPSAATPASANQEEKPQIKWVVPQGWKSVPPSTMRYASFAVVGKKGEPGDISVSVFGGDGGGDLQNVNRWRSQLGLAAIGAEELKKLIVPLTCKDGQILTVDMTSPKNHIVAGWAKIDGKSWFFKLIGPDAMAIDEKPSFEKFLQSVQFHQ